MSTAAEQRAWEDHLEYIRSSPADGGTLELIVSRPGLGEREELQEAELNLTEGLAGDSWRTRRSRSTPDGKAHPDKQVTVMNSRVAAVLAGSPERRALAGDQLYVDMDLSMENLPPGTRLAIGDALIEVTASPHLGCAKFTRHFGEDAMRFVNSPVGKAMRLRGLNAKVVVPGRVRLGDTATKLPPTDRLF